MKRFLWLLVLAPLAYATDRPPHNRPPDNRPPDVNVDVSNRVEHRGGDLNNRVETGDVTLTGGDVRTGPVEVTTGPVDINTSVTTGPTEIANHVEAPVTSVDSSPSVSISSDYKRQVPDAYFNYTPNYLDCGRVLGFQYGNTSGVGSLGIPLPRDRSCDVWRAVQEAQENGHILLSYAFMCEIRHIKNVWGIERCQELTGLAGEWWQASLGGGAEAAGKIEVEAGLADPFLLAEVSEEEFEEIKEEVEELKRVASEREQIIIRQEAALRERERDMQRRRRALEALKKGGFDTEEQKWQKRE